MVALLTYSTKYYCKQCSWSTIQTHTTSCLPSALDFIFPIRFSECPDCLSKDIVHDEPQMGDLSPPFSTVKNTYYHAKLAIKKRSQNK